MSAPYSLATSGLRIVCAGAILAVAGCGDDGLGPTPPAHVRAITGSLQVAPAGVPLAQPFVVRVTDALGAPSAGSLLFWRVTSGGGFLSRTWTRTGGNGQATTTLTPTQVGPVVVTATLAPRFGPGYPPFLRSHSLSNVEFGAIGQAEISDPAGDTFETEASAGLSVPDIVRVTSWPEFGSLWVEIEFAKTVVPANVGGPNEVVITLDIDSDQNEGTGAPPGADQFRSGPGAAGLGVDYRVFSVGAGEGGFQVYRVFDGGEARLMGTFQPGYAGTLVTMAIPLGLLGYDDGYVNLATIAGTASESTDIAPNDTHLTVGPTPYFFRW